MEEHGNSNQQWTDFLDVQFEGRHPEIALHVWVSQRTLLEKGALDNVADMHISSTIYSL